MNIYFEFLNIHINHLTQLPMINLALKWYPKNISNKVIVLKEFWQLFNMVFDSFDCDYTLFHVSWLALQHLCFNINFSLSILNGIESKDGLGLDAKPTCFWKLDDKVDGLGIGAPSIRLWCLFKMFLITSSFITFHHSSTWWHCNVFFSKTSSFEIPIFNSFNVSHK